jgi:hypothetical protein
VPKLTELVDPPLRAVVPVWDEKRDLGNTKVTVAAFVVPESGVGWVDFEWRDGSVTNRTHGGVLPVRKRMLADWSGKSHAEAVRAVIEAADAWFVYCTEQAEREKVVRALAGHSVSEHVTGTPVSDPPGIQQLLSMQQQQQLLAQGLSVSALSTPPEPRQEAVQGVLPALTGGAVFGAPHRPGDGASRLGDYVAEPEV